MLYHEPNQDNKYGYGVLLLNEGFAGISFNMDRTVSGLGNLQNPH